MEPMVQCLKHIQSPLYDRRLMILILKKTNGRRSFSESCRCSKIKDEHRYRHNEPTKGYTEKQKERPADKEKEGFRISDTFVFSE
jgi:hypothetical protein